MGRYTDTSSSPSPPPSRPKKSKHRRRERSDEKEKTKAPISENAPPEKSNVSSNLLLTTTGGAYIPPAKLRAMQAKITDKNSDAYQRIAWEALKKSIHGLINKVNVSNISEIVKQLLTENIIRGRGLFARSILLAQAASPTFTHVFAALLAIINTRLPQIGELVLKRLIHEFRKSFRRNEKEKCLTSANFMCHLVNQKVCHEILVLELLTLLLEQTTNDSVEVAILVLKECGLYLNSTAPRGCALIFEQLRRILNENQCDKRVSYMIEVMFQIRRDKWKDHPTVIEELDLIEEDDQITHTCSLLSDIDPEDRLNVYRFDAEYEANEAKYAEIRQNFLEEEESSDEDDDDDGASSNGDREEADSDGEEQRGVSGAAGASNKTEKTEIIDQTEANLVHLRRTIYLMLQSSLSADEGAHRLLQLKINPGEEYEVASMVLDCCAQTRSYESRYGRLAQRLSAVKVYQKMDEPAKKTAANFGKPLQEQTKLNLSGPCISYVEQFERIFVEQYTTIHRLETVKLRNIAMFYAHLLYTDSISWAVLQCVRLNERDTSSSGRIFIKHMLLEMSSFMGMTRMLERFRQADMQPYLAGLFPRDNPKDTRFAINFMVVIGLGGLTVDLRDFLTQVKEGKIVVPANATARDKQSPDSSSSSDSSSSDSSSSDSSSDSSSSSSEDSSPSSASGSPAKKKPAMKKPMEKENKRPIVAPEKSLKKDHRSDLGRRRRETSPSTSPPRHKSRR